MLKKVQTRLEGVPETPATAVQPAPKAEPAPKAQSSSSEKGIKAEKQEKAKMALFGKEDKREKAFKPGAEQRTYVVHPGDTLFRVAEKFYGDSTHWRKIRDANKTRIDPDGRMRAGQIIVVP